MNNKHRKTLEKIFYNPVSKNIKWRDIEALFINLGAYIQEGNGSRIRILLHGLEAVFHRPHPQKEAHPSSIINVRKFLTTAGVLL